MEKDDDDDGDKDEDGDDDPGRRLRQEGWQRVEETVDKKGEERKWQMSFRLTGDVMEKVERQRQKISRQKFFEKDTFVTLLDDDNGANA